VFLYTNTVTALPYQGGTNLVQVELLHSGGIAGGRLGTHVDAVMGPVKKAVDDVIARIRAASR
jgi:dihydroxyacetone kinase DhaKLM complex PTS-EIIA-like component DhaM